MLDSTTYSKIELLLKTKVFFGEIDPRIDSTEKVEFENAGIKLTGNFLIVWQTQKKENDILTSSVVYPLDKVVTYRTTL